MRKESWSASALKAHVKRTSCDEVVKADYTFKADIENVRSKHDRERCYATPLQIAVDQAEQTSNGEYMEFVRWLLQKGASVNETGGADFGFKIDHALILRIAKGECQAPKGLISPLHVACAHGNVEMVRLLLQHGANTSFRGRKGMTPLMSAILGDIDDSEERAETCPLEDQRQSRVAVALLLIEQGCSAHEELSNGKTSLMLAARHGLHEIVRILIERRGEMLRIDKQDAGGRTALHYACAGERGIGSILHDEKKEKEDRIIAAHWAACAQVLLDVGAEVHTQDAKGCTPLMLACAVGQTELVRDLIHQGAHVHLEISKSTEAQEPSRNESTLGMTALHFACRSGIADTVSSLLESGADIRKRDATGRTTLMHACRAKAVGEAAGHVVALLLEKCKDLLTHETPDINDGTSLKYACRHANEATLKLLVEQGADVNARGCGGRTPVAIVSLRGDLNLLKILLAHGARRLGRNALHFACRHNDARLAKLLLDNGAEIAAENDRHMTPLQTAIAHRNPETVALLLNLGADSNQRTRLLGRLGPSPLASACQKSCPPMAEALLAAGALVDEPFDPSDKRLPKSALAICASDPNMNDILAILIKMGAEVDRRGDSGCPALIFASRAGNATAVRLLLEAGADPSIQSDFEETALLDACSLEHAEIAEILINHGADLKPFEAMSDAGSILDARDALLIAIRRNMTATANLLIERGAQLHPKAVAYAISEDMISTAELAIQRNAPLGNYGGKTPLMYVCAKGLSSTVALLLEHGVALDVTPRGSFIAFGEFGQSALLFALAAGHEDIAETLIKAGAPVDQRHKYGESAIHYASRRGMMRIVTLILEKGCEVNEQSRFGHTALMQASEMGHAGVVETLAERGADLDTCDNRGRTALSRACGNQHVEVVEILLRLGANVNSWGRAEESPLVQASFCTKESTSPKIMRLLLEHGAETEVPVAEVRDIPLVALCAGYDIPRHPGLPRHDRHEHKTWNVEMAQLLIQHGAAVNIRGLHGRTPLMMACENGFDDVVACLIAHGADLNMQSFGAEQTALMQCSSALESIKAVGLLIEAGADLDLQDDDGDTALICACVDGHSDMATLLIQSGANINLCNKYRESPLASCCASGMSSVAELLIERSAKMSFHTKKSATTSFLEAVAADTAVMVHAMLERGVKLDPKRANGALLLAVQKGCTKSAQVMIEARFGLDFRNENGDHPLSVAVEKGDETIVSLLVQCGVPMDLAFDKSSRPRTPLMEAARLARADLVSLLVDAGAMVDEISSDIRHDADDGPASAQRFTRRYSMSSATKRLRLCARRSRSTLEKTDDMEGPARDLGRALSCTHAR